MIKNEDGIPWPMGVGFGLYLGVFFLSKEIDTGKLTNNEKPFFNHNTIACLNEYIS